MNISFLGCVFNDCLIHDVTFNNCAFKYCSFIDCNLDDADFKNIPCVKKFNENKLWKYTSGDEVDFESIKKILLEVKKYFPDAFVVAFHNEQKISVTEAQKLIKK